MRCFPRTPVFEKQQEPMWLNQKKSSKPSGNKRITALSFNKANNIITDIAPESHIKSNGLKVCWLIVCSNV